MEIKVFSYKYLFRGKIETNQLSISRIEQEKGSQLGSALGSMNNLFSVHRTPRREGSEEIDDSIVQPGHDSGPGTSDRLRSEDSVFTSESKTCKNNEGETRLSLGVNIKVSPSNPTRSKVNLGISSLGNHQTASKLEVISSDYTSVSVSSPAVSLQPVVSSELIPPFVNSITVSLSGDYVPVYTADAKPSQVAHEPVFTGLGTTSDMVNAHAAADQASLFTKGPDLNILSSSTNNKLLSDIFNRSECETPEIAANKFDPVGVMSALAYRGTHVEAVGGLSLKSVGCIPSEDGNIPGLVGGNDLVETEDDLAEKGNSFACAEGDSEDLAQHSVFKAQSDKPKDNSTSRKPKETPESHEPTNVSPGVQTTFNPYMHTPKPFIPKQHILSKDSPEVPLTLNPFVEASVSSEILAKPVLQDFYSSPSFLAAQKKLKYRPFNLQKVQN